MYRSFCAIFHSGVWVETGRIPNETRSNHVGVGHNLHENLARSSAGKGIGRVNSPTARLPEQTRNWPCLPCFLPPDQVNFRERSCPQTNLSRLEACARFCAKQSAAVFGKTPDKSHWQYRQLTIFLKRI